MVAPATRLMEQSLHRSLPAGRVTFEEFVERGDEDVWAEWVNGEVVPLALPVSFDHQQILGFLNVTLGVYVERRKLGHVTFAPYLMRLAEIARGRVPDLLFVKQARLHLLTHYYLDGPADLAIEITVPKSRSRDRKIKFAEYAQAGVPEYWLIDPDKKTAEFYLLDAHGNYQPAGLDQAGRYHSTSVSGFWLRVDWLWQRPLPNPLDVLRELKVI